MSLLLALGGKSQHCNNFGSYGWDKTYSERVDFMPGLDPKLPSPASTRIAMQQSDAAPAENW